MEQEHKRRVHYSGKYPKKFEEKYKEKDPEKYKDTIEHVINKGSTPAGMHISIMVDEILEFLDIKPGQRGLDATLGYGGHTSHMLEKLEGSGHIVGLDVDPIESAKTVERLRNRGFGPDIFEMELINFANIDQVAAKHGKFDFILADLGVSSMQIDNPERGFSYKVDGPLDLRLDPTRGESAADRLKRLDYEELCGMLVENSDEPFAEEIAREVIKKNKSADKIEKTTDLREIIENTIIKLPNKRLAEVLQKKDIKEADKKDLAKKSCARVFQALRIDVNQEFEVLYSFLDKLPDVLNDGGRVAILTFHSGEDRLVKKSFKELKRCGVYTDVADEVIRPSQAECIRNPRSKSTKMRWAIK